MILIKSITLFFVTFFVKMSVAQFCPILGHTPDGAYPVCGNITKIEPDFFYCRNGQVNTTYCDFPASDAPAFWYKFTCYQSGSLGFLITPNDVNSDDYDWFLFDVTGHAPMAVFYDQVPVISSNQSSTHGITGTGPAGGRAFICPADVNSINHMPNLIAGHKYLLLICHRPEPPIRTGFTLQFIGGDVDIADPLLPHLLSAKTPCGGTPLTVRFNKKIKCGSVMPDGSQFSISTGLANVIQAASQDCDKRYETDSLVLILDNTLPTGNYSITIKPDANGNEITDYCNNPIPSGETIPFVVNALTMPVMDSLTKPGCAPNELQLVFRNKIDCKSIAYNGSDFVVTGSTPVTVIGSYPICTRDPFYNSFSNAITVRLSAPISTKGNYQIRLVTGSDGNTLLDQCGLSVLEGSALNFSTKDTVNADFNYAIRLGCRIDTISYLHNGNNEVNFWQWKFDDLRNSAIQNPVILYDSFGLKHTQLIVSNGVCSDTSEIPILLRNELKAVFEATNTVCPGDLVHFTNRSVGNIVSWNWNFGNGAMSILQSPLPQSYSIPIVPTTITPQLVVKNDIGCTSTAAQNIILLDACYVYIPGAFTPNNDGLNDYLYPLNGYRTTGLLFRIFNRYGQLVFEATNPDQRWDGRFGRQAAEPGTYVWILHYTDKFTHKYVEKKGTTILIR